MIINDCASLEKVKSKLMAWLKYREFDRGIRFYTNQEWADRGETVGKGSHLTVLIEESQLNTILQGYGDLGAMNEAETELTAILQKLGYWYELGYSWSLHVYPLEF